MEKNRKQKLSVFISLVLRHQPEAAGIKLDGYGWADVDELIKGIEATGRSIDRGLLEEIVAEDAKKRYSFSEDRKRIRANQGHSIPVNVELKELEPPEILYHGTAARFLESIREQGLKPMSRLYVHLSGDKDTAGKVGKRHGKPVVLEIRAGEMQSQGQKFYFSENEVWLTKEVSPCFLSLAEEGSEVSECEADQG